MSRICLILEGSYPFTVGGVAEWTHRLIQGLHDEEFVLWTISPRGDEPFRYELPENVVEVRRVALGGSPEKDAPTHGNRQEGWNEIAAFHLELIDGDYDRFASVVMQVSEPGTRSLNLRHLLRDKQGWRLVTHFHRRNMPIEPFVDYYWSWMATHMPVFKMLQQQPPEADLYHAVSTGYAGLLGAMAKVRTGKPFLLTEHGIYAKEREMEIYGSDLVKGYQKKMWHKMFRGLAKIAYDQADQIVALFERNRKAQIELGAPPTKTRVIPNGIDPERFAEIHRNGRPPVPEIGFVGRVTPIKDVKTFILSAKILGERFPTARFTVVGPTDESPHYYRECVQLTRHLGLEGRLTFTGRADVVAYYERFDLLMLTSVKEAQPLSLIEAMTAGVPIVATDVGDVRDLLQNDGFVVPPKAPDELADAATRLLSEPARAREMARRARERALRQYDIRKIWRDYATLYHSLMYA